MIIGYVLTGLCSGLILGAVAYWSLLKGRDRTAYNRGLTDAGNQLSVAQEKISFLIKDTDELSARLESAESKLNAETEKAVKLGKECASLEAQALRTAQLDKELAAARNELSGKNSRIVQLETLIEQERKQAVEKLSMLNEAKELLKADFKDLADRIFEEKSQKLTDQNKTGIETLINPLREQLGDFKKRVEDVYDKESKERFSLGQEITRLKDLNQKISQDAVNLTNALKGDKKAQGNWGELALERVLELSGLQKGREYEIQVNTHAGDGGRYLPDVIVRLPENKDAIIDSKVSLVAYERYSSAPTDEEREVALRSHIANIRERIKELSRKNYDQLEEVRSLDYVLMFIPIEAAFVTAIKEDTTLFSDAFNKNIIIVCPSTLLVTLRTIANVWRYEYQNQNAQIIAKKAADLYDKFVTFSEVLLKTGKSIREALEHHEDALRLLSTGNGNLVRKVELFKTLGIKGKKNIPQALLQDAESAEENLVGAAGGPDETPAGS